MGKNFLKDLAILACLALIGPCYCEGAESLQTNFDGNQLLSKEATRFSFAEIFLSFFSSFISFSFLYHFREEEGDVWTITTGASGVSIEQFAIHMYSNTINVGVWHKAGMADISTTDGLVRIFDATVTGQGQGVPTLLPPFSSPVDIPPNSSHTFYTTGTQEPVSIYYTDGSSLHSTFASDSYISILEGYSVRFPYRSEHYPTQFNGRSESDMATHYSFTANFYP